MGDCLTIVTNLLVKSTTTAGKIFTLYDYTIVWYCSAVPPSLLSPLVSIQRRLCLEYSIGQHTKWPDPVEGAATDSWRHLRQAAMSGLLFMVYALNLIAASAPTQLNCCLTWFNWARTMLQNSLWPTSYKAPPPLSALSQSMPGCVRQSLWLSFVDLPRKCGTMFSLSCGSVLFGGSQRLTTTSTTTRKKQQQ